jgi:hypothetical protein
LDTLSAIGFAGTITEYTRENISDDATYGSLPGETVLTDNIIVHIGKFLFTKKGELWSSNPGLVVHAPALYVRFTEKIPFPNGSSTKMWDFDFILYLVATASVKQIKVLEY